MVHWKKFEIKDLSSKYGNEMVGYVALEPIKKGEIIFSCDQPDCMYKDSETRFNRAQIDQLINENPQLNDYIHK